MMGRIARPRGRRISFCHIPGLLAGKPMVSARCSTPVVASGVAVRYCPVEELEQGTAAYPASAWMMLYSGHQQRQTPAVPNDHRDLALLVSEFHSIIHIALELRSSTLLGSSTGPMPGANRSGSDNYWSAAAPIFMGAWALPTRSIQNPIMWQKPSRRPRPYLCVPS